MLKNIQKFDLKSPQLTWSFPNRLIGKTTPQAFDADVPTTRRARPSNRVRRLFEQAMTTNDKDITTWEWSWSHNNKKLNSTEKYICRNKNKSDYSWTDFWIFFCKKPNNIKVNKWNCLLV